MIKRDEIVGGILMLEEQRRKIILIVVLALLIVAGSFYGFYQKSSVSDSVTSGEVLAKGNKSVEEKPSEMIVYISGAVNRPGVFKVSHNTRVIDVVNLAGGLTMDADGEKINMAQLLKDGMHIHVVAKATNNQGEASSQSNNSKSVGSNLVNINMADKGMLDTLPGVGPTLAERIIEYRQANGNFSEIEGLKKVPGVGGSKFEKLKEKITI